MLTKEEQKRLKDIEDFCHYLNGGGYDTFDIEWLMDEYKKLKRLFEFTTEK